METLNDNSRGYPPNIRIRRALAASISGRRPWPQSGPAANDTSGVLRQIEYEDLAGLLHYRASTHRTGQYIPDFADTTVRRLGQAAQAVDLSRTRELRRVFDALQSASVPSVLLKGAALAYWLYPASFSRPRCDTDLLVRIEHQDTCEAVLAQLGYHRQIALPGQHVLRQSQWDYHHAGIKHSIDLHHRLSNRHMFDTVLAEDKFLNRSQPLPRLHDYARRPSLVDATLHAVVHRVAHHHNDPRLVWLYDIHLLLNHATVAERDDLVEKIESAGLIGITQSCLTQCQTLFGTNSLKLNQRPGVKDKALRLLQRQNQFSLAMMDLHAAANWSTRWAYIRDSLWPPVEYLRARYPNAQRCPASLLQLRRWIDR